MLLSTCALLAVTLTPCWGNAEPTGTLVDEVHEGRVVAVSDNEIMIIDKRDDETDKFKVTAETVVKKNGKPANLSEVRNGDQVKVTSYRQGEERIAKVIEANSPG